MTVKNLSNIYILGLNCQILFHTLYKVAVKFEMNIFEVSLETPIPIWWIINYITVGYREPQPNVTGWVGQKRSFSAWRDYAMAPWGNNFVFQFNTGSNTQHSIPENL